MNAIHRTILDAVIQKTEQLCPDAVALIGIYGSGATGDTYEKSDLDLMILIHDPRAYELCEGFILEDVGIGYDLYCTTWGMLEGDAQCGHAQLSRLLDAKIVYGKDPVSLQRLQDLRAKACSVLASEQRFERASACFDSAKNGYADCFLSENLSSVRLSAGFVIHHLLSALMLHNGRYFHKGVKRTFEELKELNLPFAIEDLIMAVVRETTVEGIRNALTQLMRRVQHYLERPREKARPSRENLTGTYEEMFSNWRNKVYEAADREDLFASFMNMASCQLMLREIAEGVAVPECDLLGSFDPDDLKANGESFDEMLRQYGEEYRKAGFLPKRYADVNAFRKAYLGEE